MRLLTIFASGALAAGLLTSSAIGAPLTLDFTARNFFGEVRQETVSGSFTFDYNLSPGDYVRTAPTAVDLTINGVAYAPEDVVIEYFLVPDGDGGLIEGLIFAGAERGIQIGTGHDFYFAIDGFYDAQTTGLIEEWSFSYFFPDPTLCPGCNEALTYDITIPGYRLADEPTPSPVPEPGVLGLLGVGMGAVGLRARRSRQR